MADEKKIDIKIAASGGDQAASEIKKVETAETGAATAAKKASEAAAPIGDNIEDIGKKSSEAGPKLDKLVNIQRAEAAAGLAKAMGSIGEKVRDTAEKFAEADPEFSRTLSNTADGLEAMSSAANLAAQGFAVGGPLGAAIGALVGVALPELKSAMDDMISSMVAASESEQQAADIQERLNRIYSQGVDAYHNALDAAQGYAENSREVTEAIKEETLAMQKRNAVADARDGADSAARDREDEARIRAGEAPEDVAIDRAGFDAAQAKAKVARDLEAKRLAQVSAVEKLQDAERGVEATQNDPTLNNKEREKELAKRKAARDAAKEAFYKSQNDFEIARDVAGQKNRAIDENTAGTIDDQAGRKAARLAREQETADRKAEAERKKEEAQKRREQEAAAREAERRDSDAASLGKSAVSLIPKNASDKARAAVEAAAAKLQDGDQGGEVAAMLKLVEQMAGYIEKTDGKNSANAIKIQQLEARMSKFRDGK